MNDTLINAYQNELAFMKQERNKWKERTKKAVKERNNLQSKIDKAIEYIDYHDVIYNNGYINEKHKFDKSINPKELHDILKEDK